jgi:hypothetical protein
MQLMRAKKVGVKEPARSSGIVNSTAPDMPNPALFTKISSLPSASKTVYESGFNGLLSVMSAVT